MGNPFRPSAGSIPPDIIGRAGLLDDFASGLDLGPSSPGLLIIVTGERGVGKTVMLSVAQDLARAHGWDVISETATKDFLDRIGETIRRRSGDPNADADSSVSTEPGPDRKGDRLTSEKYILRLLERTGLIITLDEVHAADRGELAKLTADVQRFMEKGLPIGLVVAGLPAAVSELLNDGGVTLLRQADRIELRKLAVPDVETSYAEVFSAAGFDVAPGAVRRAAEATGGYPFLVQLVGYFVWREVEDNAGVLTAAAAESGVERAHEWNARTVLDAAISAASARDVDFLCAMALDDGPSEVEEIGRRIGATSSLVGRYRTRLMAAGLIEAAGHGKVDFALPGLRRRIRAVSADSGPVISTRPPGLLPGR